MAAGPVMEWNRRDHARKFLRARARYIAAGQQHSRLITFWGEWEPQSKVIETFPAGPRGGPRWLHEPFWALPRHEKLLQNTDPLVFGERFLYSNCRQGKNQKLRELAEGSIILFGSKLRSEFVVDTVFVVGDSGQRYRRGETDSIECDEWVRAVLFDRLRSDRRSALEPLRLYRGVTYDENPDGPFRFVPCRSYMSDDAAFPRPTIRLPGRWLEPNLAMGAKVTPASQIELKTLWDEIVRQVQDAGAFLGVQLDPPPHRPE